MTIFFNTLYNVVCTVNCHFCPPLHSYIILLVNISTGMDTTEFPLFRKPILKSQWEFVFRFKNRFFNNGSVKSCSIFHNLHMIGSQLQLSVIVRMTR